MWARPKSRAPIVTLAGRGVHWKRNAEIEGAGMSDQREHEASLDFGGVDAKEVDGHQLRELLANDDVVYSATQIFDALSDFTRFQILGVLVEGERSVSDLQEVCHVSQSAISHQLKALKQAKLIKSRREGKTIFYSLADEHVYSIIATGREHIEEED